MTKSWHHFIFIRIRFVFDKHLLVSLSEIIFQSRIEYVLQHIQFYMNIGEILKNTIFSCWTFNKRPLKTHDTQTCWHVFWVNFCINVISFITVYSYSTNKLTFFVAWRKHTNLWVFFWNYSVRRLCVTYEKKKHWMIYFWGKMK